MFLTEYQEIKKLLWNSYPSLYYTEYQLVFNLLFNSTYEWNNKGELELYNEINYDDCKSILDAANDMGGKPNYWFKYFLNTYNNRRKIKFCVLCNYVNKYSSIMNIPDNINENWASVCLGICDYFLNEITFFDFCLFNFFPLKSRIKIIELNYFKEKLIFDELVKIFNEIKNICITCINKLKKLYPSLTPYEFSILERDINPPENYDETEYDISKVTINSFDDITTENEFNDFIEYIEKNINNKNLSELSNLCEKYKLSEELMLNIIFDIKSIGINELLNN